MRICYFGIYSVAPEYPRNNNIIQGLRAAGVEVSECRVELEESFEKRARVAQSITGMAVFAVKLIISYLTLSFKLMRLQKPDFFVVGHPGYFHLHLLKIIRQIFYKGVPVIYDIFIPLYDAVVCDRRFFQENSLPARIIKGLEGSVCRNADLCLIDTNEHCNYIASQFDLPRHKIKRVFVGSIFLEPDKQDYSASSLAESDESFFRVLHFSTFIPLHGMDTTIRAAKILEQEKGIRFIVVGRGQLEAQIKGLAKELQVNNVEFRDWVSVQELHELIANSHLSLGIFGTTEKTRRVIPSKAFDTLAVGRPLISGDTPAMREAFTHKENIYLVPLSDPEALAEAIKTLKQDPGLREKIALEGHRLYKEMFTPEAVGRQFMEILQENFPVKFQSGG